jgi:hypothetical protein
MPHLLEQTDYTIAAEYTDWQNSIEAASVANKIGEVCQAFGFAVVRNTFTEQEFTLLKKSCEDQLNEHIGHKWARTYNGSEARGVLKSRERRTQLSSHTMQLLGSFATSIYDASHDYKRLETPDAQIDTAYVVQFDPRGRVYKHRDHVTGVMCETNLEGRALMGFWRGRKKLADVILQSNDTVVLPAETLGNSPKQLIRHDVVNVTRANEDDNTVPATRLGLVFNYGRTRPTEVAKG